MPRIVPFSETEIVTDPGAVGLALDRVQFRKRIMRFTGICPLNGTVLFLFEEDPTRPVYRFILSPFPASDERGAAAEIMIRSQRGFYTLGAFLLGDTLWGLFGEPDSDENRGGAG